MGRGVKLCTRSTYYFFCLIFYVWYIFGANVIKAWFLYYYTPREQSSGGYIGITLSVCPSVRLPVRLSVRPSVCPSVCRFVSAHNFFMV